VRARRTGGGLRRGLAAPAIVVLALMLLPVAVVIAISVGRSATYQFPPTGVTLRWFEAFLGNPTFRDALLRVSLPLAFAVSLVSTLIGTLAAIGLSRGRFPGRRVVELLFVAPIVFPQILLGVGLFMLYAELGLTPTIVTLGLGHVLIGTPFVIRTVSGGLAGIDERLEQAAQNLGAGPVQAFCRVTLPIIRSSILSGAIFAFIASFSDINLALFLAAADAATLPVQILAQMQYASDPTIAAASTIQVILIGILVVAAQRAVTRPE
jgi:putative spermidine/putrescine transport system permease protein